MNKFRQGGFGGGNYERKPLFDAVCDDCGKNCTVPFRPNGSKPVLCSECFELKNGPRQQRFERPQFDRPRFNDNNTRVRRFERDGRPVETREEKENRHIDMLRERIEMLEMKLDKILSILETPVEEKPKKKSKKTEA